MALLDTLPTEPQSDHDQEEITQQLHHPVEQEHHHTEAGRHRRRTRVVERLRHLFRRRQDNYHPRHADWDAEDNTVELNLHAGDDTVELPIREQAVEAEESEGPDTFVETRLWVNPHIVDDVYEGVMASERGPSGHGGRTARYGVDQAEREYTAWLRANPEAPSGRRKVEHAKVGPRGRELADQMNVSLQALRDQVGDALEAGQAIDPIAVFTAYERLCTNGNVEQSVISQLQMVLRSAVEQPHKFHDPNGMMVKQSASFLRAMAAIGVLAGGDLALGMDNPGRGHISDKGEVGDYKPTFLVSWVPGQQQLEKADITADRGNDTARQVTSE